LIALCDREDEMNLCKRIGISALFLMAVTATIKAQSLISPGELSGPSGGASTPSAFIPEAGTSTVPPKTNIASVEDSHAKRVRVIWIASIFAIAASTAADAASSWHKRESNGLLASSDGTFGDRGVAIKCGITAAVLAPQVIFRKHQNWHTAFALGNFVEAGISTGAAIHNLNVNSPTK
jgi:hypothetical protein